jgi:hypothetical protein
VHRDAVNNSTGKSLRSIALMAEVLPIPGGPTNAVGTLLDTVMPKESILKIAIFAPVAKK